jgi:hypothetical protein
MWQLRLWPEQCGQHRAGLWLARRQLSVRAFDKPVWTGHDAAELGLWLGLVVSQRYYFTVPPFFSWRNGKAIVGFEYNFQSGNIFKFEIIKMIVYIK